MMPKPRPRQGGDALANIRETWEPENTLRNLRLIRISSAERNFGWGED